MFDIRKIQEQSIYEAVKSRSSEETAKTVVYGADGDGANEDAASWVNSAMRRLESTFDPTTAKLIRMDCQCGHGMDEKMALVKELMACSTNMEEFASSVRAKEAGLSFEAGSLYLQFKFCPCPMLSEVESLDTLTWCQCTTGYSKVLFEKTFGCEVDVELLKSIKHGDSICLMKIVPHDAVWR